MAAVFTRYVLGPIRALCFILILTFSTVTVSSVIILSALLICLCPHKRWRAQGFRAIGYLPDCWGWLNRAAIWVVQGRRLEIRAHGTLSMDKWYLLVSNHQSWADILLIAHLINFKAPSFRFFMKKSLIWKIPFGGLVCWILGFPMLDRKKKASLSNKQKTSLKEGRRLARDDIEKTLKACEQFKTRPTTAVMFPEGTRYTQAKHDKQRPPYKHLLNPRAGGTSVVLSQLYDQLAGVINCTIHYSTKEPSFWQFMSGNISHIRIEYEILPITQALVGDYHNDREYRIQFQAWLNALWLDKDALLEQKI